MSRIWTDQNADGTSTSVRFTGCSGASNVGVAIYRQVTGVDPAVGTTKNLCSGGGTRGYWGDLAADEYRFKIEWINGQTVDVRDVDVWY